MLSIVFAVSLASHALQLELSDAQPYMPLVSMWCLDKHALLLQPHDLRLNLRPPLPICVSLVHDSQHCFIAFGEDNSTAVGELPAHVQCHMALKLLSE